MISDLEFTDFEPKSFSAARQAFLAKTPLPSSVFEGLETSAKGAAFSIARVESMKDIMAARQVIAGVLDGRVTFREAMMALQDKFASGDFSADTLNRLRGVIHQNVAQAQAVARREALTHPSVVQEFPFWQYMTMGDGTPLKLGVRPSHAALHGLVFHYDDPFWDAHTPPWEFRCRCYWLPLRAEDVKRMGIDVRDLGFVAKELDVQANPDFAPPGNFATLSNLAKATLKRLDGDLRAKLAKLERQRETET